MPLTKRAVSPVNVSRGQIPREVNREELQYVANSTLANLIRQLSSLSKHAEHIFGEIYHDAMKLDHKSNTLQQRIDRLMAKVTQLDSCNEQASLDELQMRKAFKSSMLVDQHTLDRSTLPTALAEVYSKCDHPPNLDALNPYRESGAVSALSLYTNPSFFFDLWRMEMLKDCNDSRRRMKSPVGQGGKSPKKKRVRAQQHDVTRQQANRYMSSLRNPQINSLSFPEEYQAPQALGLQLSKNHNLQSVQSSSLFPPPGMSVRAAPIIERIVDRHHLSLSPPKDSRKESELPPPDLTLLSIDDDDEELPPPPPTVMHSSIVQQMPPQSTIQFVPNDTQIMAPLPPPPPPLGLLATPTAATFAGAKVQNEVQEEKKLDSRSNLLAEIQSGIKLKKVRLAEEAAAEKAATEMNDVAAILKRRMEHVMGKDDDSHSSGEVDDDEWED